MAAKRQKNVNKEQLAKKEPEFASGSQFRKELSEFTTLGGKILNLCTVSG